MIPRKGGKISELQRAKESDMVSLAKEFLRVVKEEGIKIVKKEEVNDETMMEATIKARAKREKEEGLAFEIFDVEDGKKVNVRKIYLNGHIEGFEGDPCIVNHLLPKIMALKTLLRQMNKDYRDLIEAYMIRGLPLENVPLHELYIREMKGIENIKI